MARAKPKRASSSHDELIEALRSAEEQLQGIFDHAFVGIFRSSRDGRILLANRAFARMLGYDSPEELVALDLARDVYVDPAERETLVARYEPLRAGWAVEIRWKKRDGTPIWVLVNARAVKDEAGRLLYFEGFAQDVTERRRGEELRQHLLARAISAQEEERRRVARELHDETGQVLSALLVGLRTVEEAETLPRARDVAQRLRELAAQAVRNVGRLARGLRPSILDDLGLGTAIRRLAEEVNESGRVQVRVVGAPADRLPATVETTLYRIIQEAITNVLRHAQARRADVSISRDADTVVAVVRDDGIGFDVAATLDHSARREPFGVLAMQERAALLGGTVVIESRPGVGTTVTTRLPVAG